MKPISEATLEKAEALFNEYGTIITGHGLSRRELRQMERAGYVEKRLMKNKDTGSLIYEWKPVQISREIIKKP